MNKESQNVARQLGTTFLVVGVLLICVWGKETEQAKILAKPVRVVSLRQLAAMSPDEPDRNVRVVDFEFLRGFAVEEKDGRWGDILLAMIPEGVDTNGARVEALVTIRGIATEEDVGKFMERDSVTAIRSANRAVIPDAFEKLRKMNPGMSIEKVWMLDTGRTPGVEKSFLHWFLIGGLVSLGLAVVCGLAWLGAFTETPAPAAGAPGTAASPTSAAPLRQSLFDDDPPPGPRA